MAKKPSTIPKNAHRVFKGVIFDVYHWQQKMFDGTPVTFEMLKRPDTVEIVAIVGDKILVQQEEQPVEGKFLTLPGGRIEANETTAQGAKRELLEETGFSAKSFKIWQTKQPYSKIEWTIFTLIARDCKKIQLATPDAGEKISPRLVTFQQFLALADNPNFRTTHLKEFLSQIRGKPKLEKKFHAQLFAK